MSDLRAELLRIRAERGVLTADLVLEEATPEDSELHEHFEWDNEIAGPRFRRYQALTLIRSVRVSFTKPNGEINSVRQFVVVGAPTPVARFEPVEEVAADPISRMILLRQMQRDWQNFKSRYAVMDEFIGLLQAELGSTG